VYHRDLLTGVRAMKEPCVYIAASKRDGVLYIGVTGDLHDRMAIHDQALAWKVRLIESINPEWVNLFDPDSGEIFEGPADSARRIPPA
jgi:putative endonuclease